MAGKVFIITGASKGIGAAVVQRLLKQSHNVVLAARSKELLERVKSSHPGQVEYIAGDLTDSSIAGKLVDTAVKTFGKVDGLVINHSILLPKKLGDTPMEELKQVYEVNVFSCFALAHAAMDELRKNKGAIVWTSSGASQKSYVAWGAYGSSKAAINSISANIAVEEAGIMSVCIAPGRVDTEMQATIRAHGKESMSKAEYDSFVDAFNQGKLLRPEQPGNVIANLVATPSKEISGKYLNWNGPELAAYQG